MVSPVAMSANATMAMTLPVIQKRVGRQHVPVGPDGRASSWARTTAPRHCRLTLRCRRSSRQPASMGGARRKEGSPRARLARRDSGLGTLTIVATTIVATTIVATTIVATTIVVATIVVAGVTAAIAARVTATVARITATVAAGIAARVTAAVAAAGIATVAAGIAARVTAAVAAGIAARVTATVARVTATVAAGIAAAICRISTRVRRFAWIRAPVISGVAAAGDGRVPRVAGKSSACAATRHAPTAVVRPTSATVVASAEYASP
jgi:hypothetical protein